MVAYYKQIFKYCIRISVVMNLVSCASGETSGIEIAIPSQSVNELEELIENSSYISLETTPECYISEVDKMVCDSSLFYIKNRDAILIFNQWGKYQYGINKRGRANNEYLSITDFDVLNGDIYILSNAQRKIVIYRGQDFISEIRLNDWYHNLSVESDYILLYSEKANSQGFDIIKINHNGDVIGKFLPFSVESSKRFGTSPFNKIGYDDYFLTFPYDHRLIKMSNGKWKSLYNIKVDKSKVLSDEEINNLRYDEIAKSQSGNNYLRRIVAVSQKEKKLFLLLEVSYKNSGIWNILCRINMDTLDVSSYLCGAKLNNQYSYFSNFIAMDDEYLYSIIPLSYINHVNNILGKSQDGTLDELNNPRVYKYRLKWD